jgi:hypothetical protein
MSLNNTDNSRGLWAPFEYPGLSEKEKLEAEKSLKAMGFDLEKMKASSDTEKSTDTDFDNKF